MDILHEIAGRTLERVEARKEALPLDSLVERVRLRCGDGPSSPADFPFEKALCSEGMAFICEVKKASPSKGVIAEDFPYLDIAREYEAAGAAAISVLTEPHYFKGDDRHLREIAEVASIPLLRKDFTVDSYMVYEARLMGASAVLLIAALLDEDRLAAYIDTAHRLGLSALVEIGRAHV